MKKSIVSFLVATLLLSSVSSVALAEQNAVSPQGLITPLADSGWQTKNKIRARVYTDANSYGPGTNKIKITAEKSTAGAAYYQLYLMNSTQMVQVGSGTIGSSVTLDAAVSNIVPVNSQASIKVLLKIYAYGDWDTWLGDWETDSFTVVRIN
ncbi:MULTISPECIES: hypothetical protein [unclassified Paenibacillus]|uniref:hypothetical protein n=1 Tax=unclassified Paenibacillus TaxID=185978 RepID=UPI00034E57DD|nr:MULTISPECIES: hypothetical protein [unclassified Paenibacillus]EPD81264.1 hypothetical protein HMPREF1207_05021 [Paenibacillus sp. HGH0039]